MSIANLDFRESLHVDEGVIITRTTASYFVTLPDPASTHHQLGIVAELWKAWLASQDDESDKQLEFTIVVSALDRMTLPLISIIAAVHNELKLAGRKLVVLDGRTCSPVTLDIDSMYQGADFRT